jgi:Fuc2NAc and GlcNAc transferase
VPGWSADRIGPLDHPNERSSLSSPAPKGGGAGILAVFLLSTMGPGLPVLFWLSLGLMGALGFLGDWVELSPKFRRPVQLLTAGAVAAGVRSVGRNDPRNAA